MIFVILNGVSWFQRTRGILDLTPHFGCTHLACLMSLVLWAVQVPREISLVSEGKENVR